MELSEKAEFFRHKRGVIIVLDDLVHIFFANSASAKSLQELHANGFLGSGFKTTVEEVESGKKFRIERDYNTDNSKIVVTESTLIPNGEYHLIPKPKKSPALIPFPPAWVIDRLFWMPLDVIIMVMIDKRRWNTFRLFIGKASALKEISCQFKPNGFRSGQHPDWLVTSVGDLTLYPLSKSGYGDKLEPTGISKWRNTPLTDLSLDDFRIMSKQGQKEGGQQVYSVRQILP